MSRVRMVFDARGEVVDYAVAPAKRSLRSLSRDEESELELRALVGYAWEQRGERTDDGLPDPDLLAACAEIGDWHDRRYIRAWERRQRQTALVLQVLRETDLSEDWTGEESRAA